MENDSEYLIVGLGNPGARYEKTRHNFGFMVVAAFAKRRGWSFKKGVRIQGHLASGVFEEKKIHLLLPSTYMNLSGRAARSASSYYKIASENVMVVVDEVHLPFGRMRLRAKGSAGGHNGLKSIESSLRTQFYPRLRMGVGPRDEETLSSHTQRSLEGYVLGRFAAQEGKVLPELIDLGVDLLEKWLCLGIDSASELAGQLRLSEEQ